MPKQIVSEMHWNEKELAELPLEDGFRMRGLETTRLDTLIDAAFAFVLSILVISQSGIPETYDELLSGIKSIPALGMSFLVLMLLWLGHREWSRRYGIESKSTIIISVSLVFALLIYVYPLRLLFEFMFYGLSSGALPVSFAINKESEIRGFFVFYSCGYLVLSVLMGGLHGAALRRAKLLSLNAFEYWDTKATIFNWVVSGIVSILALVLAVTLPVKYIGLAGYIYFTLFVVQLVHLLLRIKARKRLVMI